MSLMIGLNAHASPASLTYQGRIVKADGSPLEYGNVSFQFEILSSSGLCVLYREQVNGINMVHSNGIFDVRIGASHSYPLSASFSIVDSFNNSVNQTCDGGSVFAPSATEGRIMRVQFHDGTAWRLISPDTQIRSVPYAGYATSAAKLGDKTAADFVARPAVCTAGQVITFDGTNFNCAAGGGGGGGSGTVTSVVAGAGLAGGTITTTGTISLAPIADKSLLANISGSSAVPTATTISALIDSAISNTQGGILYRNNTGWVALPPGTNGQYLQTQGASANPQWATVSAGSSGTVTSVSAGTGLTGGPITTSGSLAVNVGTGANQIPQLDGSGKLVAAVIPTNIVTSSTTLGGDLSGNLPNPNVVGLRGRAIDATAPTDGQVLIWDNGNTTWKAQHVRMEDVRNAWGGTQMIPATACAANQAMIWSVLTDRFTCQNIGSLDAAAITTGVLNTGRLGTGTADNTKYLRGDGTWQTISSSDATKLPLAGGQMAGDIDMNTHKITNVSNVPWTAVNPGGSNDMQSLRWDDTAKEWKWFTAGAAGSGITSVNGATGAAHTLAPTASGTSYGFTTSSNTHTFSIPSASGAGVTAGTISKTEYDSFAAKQAPGNYATALSGDVTSTGYSAGTLTTSIANNAVVTAKINDGAVTGAKLEDVSGLVAGTYPKVTVDAKGRVTTGASLAATDIPNLDAAKIATGVFPVARLATGTPDGTKFLRDDGTWQPVSVTETDPQVGANTTNYVSKWDGSALVASGISEVSGNVGIGIASASYPLEIQKNHNGETSLRLRNTNTGNASEAGIVIENNAGIAGNIFSTSANYAAVTAYQDRFNVVAATNVSGLTLAAENGDIRFLATGQNERMRMTATGDLGIGVVSPDAKLHVAGQIKITGGSPGLGKVLTSDANGLATWQTASVTETDPQVGANATNYLSKWDGSALVTSGVFENGGNVGIGTGSPGAPLDIGGTVKLGLNAAGGADQFVFSNTTGNAYLFGYSTGNTSATIGAYNWNTSSGVDLVFNPSGGNVGIGTTSPTSALDVNGVVRIRGGTPGAGKVLTASDANGNATWVTPTAGGSGTVTSVAAGTGLTGGTITTTGTLAVNVGTGANQIPQLDGSGKLLAAVLPTDLVTTSTTLGDDLSGSLPNPKVVRVQGRAVASTAPADGQVMLWDTNTWKPEYVRMQDIRNAWGGTQMIPSTACTASETMAWSVVTDRFTCQSIGSLNASTITGGVLATGRLGTGTADATTYLRGDGTWQSISSSETDPKVGANTTNYLSKWNGTALVASAVSESSGSVGIGTASPSQKLHVRSANASDEIRIENTSSSAARNPRVAIVNYQGAVAGSGGFPETRFVNLRGTSASASATTSGDMLGIMSFYGMGATDWVQGAKISVGTEETFTDGTAASYMTFATTSSGAASSTEKIRITASGNVGVGTTSPGAKLEVAGQVKITGGSPGNGKVLTSDGAGLASWQNVSYSETDPKIGSNSTNYVSKWNGSALVASGISDDGTNVAVTGNLRTTGQISTPSQALTVASIDWNSGNTAKTSYDCSGNLSFANLRDGGTYTLVVTSTGTTQCSFSTTTTGTDSGTVSYRFKPANAARTASSYTVYTLLRVGNEVLVSWTSGF
ncbi:beta strand repeat-containing protein [Bdellovibrio bacteriovorus]|uniref:beta strand repeat-containing protein n=1 Tax=Bdellovibrio bacteriovorus TaxID=959 RepID=UPI0012FC2F6A|nr:hypothetical protein [Bdellovibrio bacteriovorus]